MFIVPEEQPADCSGQPDPEQILIDARPVESASGVIAVIMQRVHAVLSVENLC